MPITPTNGLPAINVDHLVFEYPGVRALDDVSFAIPKGSITALVGPNGAGKTTLLRCIAALDQPLSGRIQVDDVDVLAEPRLCHRRVGYLSDSFGLYESLTVRQCLSYAAEANGLDHPGVPAAVQQTAQRLNLQDRLEQKAGELSRGLRQRVAIGQAIIHGPALVLLDEPAAGLDPEARHQLSSLFRALQADGMSLLVSSHILAELAEYSTSMLVLKDGRIAGHESIAPIPAAGAALQLSLAAPVPDIEARLATQAGVSKVQGNEGGVSVRFHFIGDATERHRLLRDLIGAGIPVSGLAEANPDMQASYLASIHSSRQERAR